MTDYKGRITSITMDAIRDAGAAPNRGAAVIEALASNLGRASALLSMLDDNTTNTLLEGAASYAMEEAALTKRQYHQYTSLKM